MFVAKIFIGYICNFPIINYSHYCYNVGTAETSLLEFMKDGIVITNLIVNLSVHWYKADYF